MFDFHLDRFEYFNTQTMNTKKSLIPFIESLMGPLKPGQKVLEIGSAEGGVLKAFLDKGCAGIGIELDCLRVKQSKKYLLEEIANGTVEIYQGDIFDKVFESEFTGKFDMIILKDVIEHIQNQDGLVRLLKNFLRPAGVIYFGFPPWKMPFGGHQQICNSKILSRLPWIHLFPPVIYKAILEGFGEASHYLMDIKKTGISIEQFEKIVRRLGYKIIGKKHYLINPIYEYKFGIRTKEQFALLSRIPYLRDFFTTAVYYLTIAD
jgi:SAM-dependent methyltransferase